MTDMTPERIADILRMLDEMIEGFDGKRLPPARVDRGMVVFAKYGLREDEIRAIHTALTAANERAEQALHGALRYADEAGRFAETIATLEAENARLREALTEIGDMTALDDGFNPRTMRRLAQQAVGAR